MLKGLGGLSGLGDLGKMMKAAQDMQERVAQLHAELSATVVTGESGAGLVRARCTARGELTGLDIDPSIFNADEKEVVEDLILAAIKDAQKKAADHTAEQSRKLTESMGLPTDVKLPF